MTTAVVNDLEVFYERWGEGPRLLYLNGSGATIATTELLIKLFTGDFETLVHDQRLAAGLSFKVRGNAVINSTGAIDVTGLGLYGGHSGTNTSDAAEGSGVGVIRMPPLILRILILV